MNRRDFFSSSLLTSLGLALALCTSFTSSHADSDAELRAKWEAMPKEKKEQLVQRWKEFSSLSKAEQAGLWAALARFEAFPAERRNRIQRNYERWKSYSPEKKAAIRKNFQEFKSRSPGEQDQFRERATGGGADVAK